jgi:NAD(P)-dependent dehydrogenase (short-subunit alcohol dehydrogenase family)
MDMVSKTWFVTGTSTGFGRALAEELISAGHNVVATARNKNAIQDLYDKAPERVLITNLEVTDTGSIHQAVEETLHRFQTIDVLVNNAGFGLVGAVEEVSLDEARQQFDVNVFGLLAVTQAVLPHMRKEGRGHIINISSQAGFVATPGLGIYAASKFAVEGITEALAAEVKPMGIRVTSIQPGPFRTQWAGANMQRATRKLEAYAETAGATDAMFHRINGSQPGDPVKAAQAIMKVVDSENPPLRLPLGQIAMDRISSKLKTVHDELETWKEVGLNTSF